MSKYDFLEVQRIVAAGTLTGLFLAATGGCTGEDMGTISPDANATMNTSFTDHDREVAEDPASSCYNETLDHPSVYRDLIDGLHSRPWFNLDELSNGNATAYKINASLEALHEIGGDPRSVSGKFLVQPGDTYRFCVSDDGEIVPADPVNYTATHE